MLHSIKTHGFLGKCWMIGVPVFVLLCIILLLWHFSEGYPLERLSETRITGTLTEPMDSKRHSYMNSLMKSQILGWQAHRVSDKLVCFKFTSVEERDASWWGIYYSHTQGFVSCYAEDICKETDGIGQIRFSVFHDAPSVNISLETFTSISPRSSALPEGYSYLDSDLSVFQYVFDRKNVYHNTVDNKALLFSAQYDLGLFDLKKLEVNKNVDIFSTTLVVSDPKPGPMDFLYTYLTNHSVSYEVNLPQPGVCMRHAFIHLPHLVLPDLRMENADPAPNPIPRINSMLFSRFMLAQIIDERFPETSYLSTLRQDQATANRNAYQTVQWIAQQERELIWPKTIKGVTHRGTHVIFLLRISSGRTVKNWADMRSRIEPQLTSRGYTSSFINPLEMTPKDQVLLFSRGTVLVSSHGAGMTHALWMVPQSIMLEIRRPEKPPKFFKELAADFGLSYFELETLDDAQGNFDLNLDRFEDTLKSAIWRSDQAFGVPEGCKDPITDSEATAAHFRVYVPAWKSTLEAKA